MTHSNAGSPSDSKYEKILAAALRAFANSGFHESKISDIARDAGVADGTIYLYFANKDDLLISLFETKLGEINTGLREKLASADSATQRLEQIIRYHLGIAGGDADLATFVTIELRRSAKFMKAYAKAQLSEYLDQWAAVIDAGKANGEFRADISTGMFKHLLFGALDQACVTWLQNPNRQASDLDHVADQLGRFVLRALSVQS